MDIHKAPDNEPGGRSPHDVDEFIEFGDESLSRVVAQDERVEAHDDPQAHGDEELNTTPIEELLFPIVSSPHKAASLPWPFKSVRRRQRK